MKKVISRIWLSITGGVVWLFARKRAIALSAAVLAALWIMYSQAQNGRYTLQFTSGDATVVLDTRTGTVYRQIEGGWVEFQPQTGILNIHPTREKEKK